MPEYVPDLSFVVDGLPPAGPENLTDAGKVADPLTAPEPLVAVQVNGHEVTAHRCLLDRPGEAVAAEVTVTVSLSFEDVVAVLVAANPTYAEELPDDDYLRVIVAGAVLNNGCLTIEGWRCGPGPGFTVDDGSAEYVAAVRRRAAEVFAGRVMSHA